MDHWPFVIAAYGVFFALLLGDFISTFMTRRRVLGAIRGRLIREQRRSKA
jgi:heme exporter protein CcmD